MFLTTMQGGGNSIEVKHRFLHRLDVFVPCLSLISISSYVVQGTKETGNIYIIIYMRLTSCAHHYVNNAQKIQLWWLGGLLHKKCHSAMVDRIPSSMVYQPFRGGKPPCR